MFMTNPVLELNWVLSGSEVHPWVVLSYADGHKHDNNLWLLTWRVWIIKSRQ